MDSRIQDKIIKLLRLSEKAGTEAEAQSAMEKAHALLAKHNLELSDLKEKVDCDYLWYPQPKKHLWEEKIWNSIARLYFCRFYTEKHRNRVDYCLVGDKNNCLVAKTISLYVVEIGKELSQPKDFNAMDAKAFRFGFSERIQERASELRSQEYVISNGTQIMLHPLYDKSDETISEFLSEEGIKLKTTTRSVAISSQEARDKGRQAAETVPLTKDLINE